jgi:hypothetical protein
MTMTPDREQIARVLSVSRLRRVLHACAGVARRIRSFVGRADARITGGFMTRISARVAVRRGPPALLLDFSHPQRSSMAPALTALSIGAVLMSFAVWHGERATELVAGLDAEMTALEGRSKSKSADESPRPARTGDVGERVRRANVVIRTLALPWGAVFSSLETSNTADAALLSLEPDGSRSAIKGSAEARNASAMMSYLEQLGQSEAVGLPVLLTHQIMTEDPQRPIRFTFTATWKTE